jgi:hypothetical protein
MDLTNGHTSITTATQYTILYNKPIGLHNNLRIPPRLTLRSIYVFLIIISWRASALEMVLVLQNICIIHVMYCMYTQRSAGCEARSQTLQTCSNSLHFQTSLHSITYCTLFQVLVARNPKKTLKSSLKFLYNFY